MDNQLTASDHFYHKQPELIKECLLALKAIILKQHPNITPAWKYGMPFFYYNNKMFCYLWVHKKLGQPYLGIVNGKLLEHPDLIIEKRSRMKIMLFDHTADLPADTIQHILQKSLALYTK